MDPFVILITHSQDRLTVDWVEDSLRERGVDCARIDTDLFPTEMALTTRYHNGEVEQWLETSAGGVAFNEITGVWNRRMWAGMVSSDFGPGFQDYCFRNCQTHFLDALRMLGNVRWVNPIEEGTLAESKLVQLQAATRCGLRIPDTVITNHPDEAAELLDRHDVIVTKALTKGTQSMSGETMMATRELTEENRDGLKAIIYAPQIFQNRLPKARELRAIVVGDEVFVGAIEADGSVDWRTNKPGEESPWTVGELTPPTREGALRLMEDLGLVFGAFDFIVTPEGDEYFLEVNPAGEWGWLQRDLDLPIAQAIAAELVGD